MYSSLAVTVWHMLYVIVIKNVTCILVVYYRRTIMYLSILIYLCMLLYPYIKMLLYTFHIHIGLKIYVRIRSNVAKKLKLSLIFQLQGK